MAQDGLLNVQSNRERAARERRTEAMSRVFPYLQNTGLRLPYNFMPGSYPGGIHNVAKNEATWNAYTWGGPGDATGPSYLLAEYPDPDPNASAKPTWSELQGASLLAELDHARYNKLDEITAQEEMRICAAYGQTDINAEILYRLRAARRADTATLDAQDAERDRLHGAANTLRARVNAAGDIAALEAIDPADDALWVAP